MSLFAQTMTRAISDYRALLRRYLDQVARMTTLQRLRLRQAETYQSDLTLYNTGWAIIEDIENNLLTEITAKENNYYSYSGIAQFCTYLKNYLNSYHLEGERVVHRAQQASRAQLSAIQLIASEKQAEDVRKQLLEYNAIIVNSGSKAQRDLQQQALLEAQQQHPDFYTGILSHFESLLSERFSEAS